MGMNWIVTILNQFARCKLARIECRTASPLILGFDKLGILRLINWIVLYGHEVDSHYTKAVHSVQVARHKVLYHVSSHFGAWQVRLKWESTNSILCIVHKILDLLFHIWLLNNSTSPNFAFELLRLDLYFFKTLNKIFLFELPKKKNRSFCHRSTFLVDFFPQRIRKYNIGEINDEIDLWSGIKDR